MSAPRGVERLLNVIMTIGSRRRITRETLFQVIPDYAGAPSQVAAERMFERDKAEILDLGLNLVTEVDPWDESVVHYRILREGGPLPALDLTPAEYTVLLAASRAWDETAAGGAARRVRAKLLSLGQEVDEDLVRRTPSGSLESLPVLTPLLEAVAAERGVAFRYRAATGRSTERRVEPWIVGVHAGHWYLLGHDLDRGERRVFRASRIESFPRLRGVRTVPVPAHLALEDAIDQAGAWSAERADALFAVEPYKALPLRDAAGADPAAERVLRRQITRTAARRTVLAHARWVSLLAPEPWREEVRAVLEQIRALHERPADLAARERAPLRAPVRIRTSSSSTDHLSRLIAEAAFVLARGQARLEDMAAEFGITVPRLVEDLQILFVCGDLGAGWEDFIEAEWEGGWVRVRNAEALGGPLRLTPAEATALLAGLKALDPASGTERELVASARRKLGALLTGTSAPAPEAGEGRGTRAATGELGRADRVLEGIQRALAADAGITLRYSPPDRPGTSVRAVRPLRLESRDGRAYLRATEQGGRAERTFRIDRIVELLDPAAVAEPPSEAPGTAPGAVAESPLAEVWLRLEPAGAWIAEAFGAWEVREAPGQEAVFALLVEPVRAALVDAVLEAAGSAEVLEPAGLRDQIVTVARAAALRHQAPSR